MPGARRSTRHTTTAAPKYNEDSASSANEAAPKRNAKKPTRQKRAWEEDADNDVKDDGPSPAKKTTKAKSKPKLTEFEPKPSKTNAAPPDHSNESNRDADGNQQVFWLLKAEPLPRYENGVNVAFSIDNLAACTEPEPWGGVRNPQARNNMQAMRKGDLGFFYHSNAKPSGVVGILRVVEEAKADETAFDSKDPYYDPKSDRSKPKWYCVGVEFVRKFDSVIDLKSIKDNAASSGELKNMQLITNGRLSVCRVRKGEWDFILKMAEGNDENEGSNEPNDGKQDHAEKATR